MFARKREEADPVREQISGHIIAAEKFLRVGRLNEARYEADFVAQLDPKNYYARSLQERIRAIERRKHATEEESVRTEEAVRDRQREIIAQILKVADGLIAQKDYKRALMQVAKVFAIDPQNTFANAYSARIEQLMLDTPAPQAGASPAASGPRVFQPPKAESSPQVIPLSRAATVGMYKELLREMWSDGKLKTEEEEELEKVRNQFAISPQEHAQVEREVKVDAYIEALRIAWRDGEMSQQERDVLETMRSRYGISMEEHMSAEARILWAKRAPDAKGTILIVEDDSGLLRVLSEELREHGFTVITALSCEEALDKMKVQAPSLILADVIFDSGRMDGFSFYRVIRDHPKLLHTPFLLMSAVSDEFVVRAGLRLGVDDFFTKPLNLELLLASIEGKIKATAH